MSASSIWSLISPFPLWWIAALDWRSKSAKRSPSSECVARLRFTDAVMIALCVSSVYFGIFAVRYVLSGASTFSRSQLIFFAIGGFASHLLLFGLVFSTFKVADGISQRISQSRRLAVIVRSALIALVLALILRKVVFVAVSFTGGVADFAAFALSASFVAYAATSLLRCGDLGSASEVSHYTLTLRRLFLSASPFAMGSTCLIFIRGVPLRLLHACVFAGCRLAGTASENLCDIGLDCDVRRYSAQSGSHDQRSGIRCQLCSSCCWRVRFYTELFSLADQRLRERCDSMSRRSP